MVNRKERERIAAETVEILKRGTYQVAGRAPVSISEELAAARRGTVLYTPESLAGLLQSLPPVAPRNTSFVVENCTTLSAAKALVADRQDANPVCLNFASAKNPGGGFLSGSQAQEESLARASGLYACLTEQPAYYDANRACGTSLYTDHIIYSPDVPVFRDDSDQLIERPFQVSIITAPAVNAGAVRHNEPGNVGRIAAAMRRRGEAVLAIARHHGHTNLVLGAWGCGVFANDPEQVAGWFHDALTRDRHFTGAFDRVVFAVLDRTKELTTWEAFHDRF